MNNYFRYSNDTCPICGNTFTPADDIVVCPLCGTPHHRACYNQNGSCGNEDKHNDGFHWVSASENANGSAANNGYAPDMNQEQSEDDRFFPFSPMQNPFQAFPENIEEDIPTPEAAAFVQTGAFKYTQKFFYEKSGKRTFNWAAFIFSPYWFFFRKMYKLGIIFAVLTLLLSCTAFIPSVSSLIKETNEIAIQYSASTTAEELESFYSEFGKVMAENKTGMLIVTARFFVQLALALTAGFIANKSYYNHIVRKIREIHTGAQTPDLARMRMQKEGGITALLPLAVFFAIDGLTSVLQMIIFK